MIAFKLYRLLLTLGFHRNATLLDSEYDLLQREEESLWGQRLADGREARTHKYSNLRAYYKNKYSSKKTARDDDVA